MEHLDYIFRFEKYALLVCLITLFGAIPTAVQAQESYQDWSQKYQEGYAEYRQNFENGVANSEEAYEEYREAYQEEFRKFKEEMKQKWGDFKERSNKQWVEYKENGNLRISADFEKGSAKVEVLAESKEEAERIKEDMPEKTAQAVKSKGTREGFETDKLPNKDVTEEPVLDDQLPKSEDETVDEYTKKVAEKETKTKEVKGDDGATRYVVYVDLKLANNHVQKRARKVEEDVYKFAKEHNIDPALVFAIIHVESYFNPTAASHANAYGLMQLVPSTGGRDAYRKIFNKDGIPTKEFLFQPSNNIQMGCTFIDILTSNYFSRAEDDKTRQYLMISAYNTGAGNVAVAYTGDTSLSRAFPKINKMSPEENYNFLRENLEYAEARNYLKKVTSRQQQYNQWKVKAKTKE
ncbi:murein transglycosylase domain-containing protein [Fodinibius saliphilus]|uniref:transglycosylase SLT domain-containing protein n=1 Tax=Fodinibius saliphilus TaxID=1920650 RepID=UPI001108D435|nr:murein transglycosylase domain-containing protein [Fodinibius saliphilus]